MPSPREQLPPPRNRRRQETMPGGLLWILVLIGLGLLLLFALSSNGPGEIGYSDFMKLAGENKFASITIKGDDKMIGDIKPADEEGFREDIRKQIRSHRVATKIPTRGNQQRQRHPQVVGTRRQVQRRKRIRRLDRAARHVSFCPPCC